MAGHAYGRGGLAGLLGDAGVRPLGQVAQRHDTAHGVGQIGDGVEQGFESLGMDQPVQRLRLWCGDVEQRLAAGGASGSPPRVHEIRGSGHRVSKAAVGVREAVRVCELDHQVLHQIFGDVLTQCKLQEQAVEARALVVEQFEHLTPVLDRRSPDLH